MSTSLLQSLPCDPQSLLKLLQREQATRKSLRKLTEYKPYPKQAEFHALGLTKKQRLLLGGNRIGKTECGAAETAIHLTGRYPDWWQGKRFDGPIRAWAAGVTGESTRDVVQAKLFGPPERRDEWGTGMVPKDAIGELSTGRGIADAIDTASVKHQSGGWSTIAFKTYEKGRAKWQGTALEVLWLDEECESPIYTEGLTRTNETGGIVYMTCTPLLGMSEVMKSFLLDRTVDMAVVQAGIEDAGHFSAEDRARIVLQYKSKPYELDARTRGIPQLGSGKVFPVGQDEIEIPAFSIPPHWPRIGGLDFGWDHPSAATQLTWDRDADVIYVISAHRQREQTPAMFAASVKPWGPIPWAWPHDGLQHEKGSGEQLAKQYKDQGLLMLPNRATFEDGTSFVEPGITEMLDRMQTGRWKVFSHLSEYFEEFNLYHRKDGLIVKKGDDLISSSRMAYMMRRFARTMAKTVRPVSHGNRGAGGAQGWMG